jgi:hypothetical protein
MQRRIRVAAFATALLVGISLLGFVPPADAAPCIHVRAIPPVTLSPTDICLP